MTMESRCKVHLPVQQCLFVSLYGQLFDPLSYTESCCMRKSTAAVVVDVCPSKNSNACTSRGRASCWQSCAREARCSGRHWRSVISGMKLELGQSGHMVIGILASCTQVSPPGMHMLHLCFADDIRTPESDPNLVGTDFPKASEDQIAAAEAMIDKLSMGESAYVGMLQNPMLQRHYQVCIRAVRRYSGV